MVAHSGGETFDGLVGPDGREAKDADRSAGANFKLHRGLPRIGPGSLRMAFGALAQPLRHTPGQLVAGWLPGGFISTESLKDTVRRAVPGSWVDHPNFWAVATDYESGRRVAFGRKGSPPAELPDAVAASCAIPGFFRPVEIGGRRYVDGGICSPSSLDLLADRDLDLVICLNPMSSRAQRVLRNPLDRVGEALRKGSGRRLGHEAKKVGASGTEVVLIQPTDEDLALIGRNPMSRKRRHDVIELAMRTVDEQLDGIPELRGLPKGEPHKIERPSGHPSTWPAIGPSLRGERAA
jgi:NTE family protein